MTEIKEYIIRFKIDKLKIWVRKDTFIIGEVNFSIFDELEKICK